MRILLLICAALAGAAGLGQEGVLLSAAGLALGHGRSGALGLSAFVAGWALGAWLAGRSRIAPRWTLLIAAGLVLVCGAILPRAVFSAASERPGAWIASATALIALAAAGLPQGMILPSLARALAARANAARASIVALYAVNLAGCVAGAQWIGFQAVASYGRLTAADIATGIGVLAASLGALGAWSSRSAPAKADPSAAPDAAVTVAQAGWILGWMTLSCLGMEWILLRLAVLWLDSLQATLSAVLAASLLALAIGAAALPAFVARGRTGILALLAVAVAGSGWPFAAAPLLVRAQGWHPLVFALVLVGPALFAFGALVPALHRSIAGESGARLGQLLLHEAWGALAAGPLVHWVLVPHFGLGGAIAALCACAAIASLALMRTAPMGAGLVCAFAIACCAGLALAPQPALSTPLYDDPALSVESFSEDSHFAVAVVDDGVQGERTLLTDRFRAAGTGRDYLYMRVLGHLPMLLHPRPERVAVLGLGTGTTVGAVFLHPEAARIDVLELSQAVVEAAPWFAEVNHSALEHDRNAQARVVLALGDGRRTLAERSATYDVITMEPLLPDSPFGVYLYTPEFYAVARRALRPDGLLCQWVPPHALEPEVFDAVLHSFAQSFPWSSVWLFGTQVILLGGERTPTLSPDRFPADSSDLRAALAELGLDTPAHVAVRCLGDGSTLAKAPRELSDVDPWIAFRSKPHDARVFDWLPRNLRAVAENRSRLREAWCAEFLQPADVQAHERLLDARVRAAELEAAVRHGLAVASEERSALERDVQRVGEELALDPEARAFVNEFEFFDHLRRGVALLQGSTDREVAGQAADLLLRSTELRPERADAQLYVAVALHRLGLKPGADAAFARAQALCPRIMETSAGNRALGLGLSVPASSVSSNH